MRNRRIVRGNDGMGRHGCRSCTAGMIAPYPCTPGILADAVCSSLSFRRRARACATCDVSRAPSMPCPCDPSWPQGCVAWCRSGRLLPVTEEETAAVALGVARPAVPEAETKASLGCIRCTGSCIGSDRSRSFRCTVGTSRWLGGRRSRTDLALLCSGHSCSMRYRSQLEVGRCLRPSVAGLTQAYRLATTAATGEAIAWAWSAAPKRCAIAVAVALLA